MTDSQRSEVARRREAGESANALAAEFEIDRRTATRIVKQAGVEVRYRVGVDIEIARAFYASGWSLASVGVEFGVSARTVPNRFCRAGLPTCPVGTNQWQGELDR